MRLASYPRFPLATIPTPLTRAHNLERILGPDCPRIYIKRDDLTGLAFGGNKARKLEYLVAHAIGKGATVLITEGAAQSNHARMTAAAAAIAGLRCCLVLDARLGAEVQGNLLLDHLMGAQVTIVADKHERREAMERVFQQLTTAGEVPYLIPTGGSVPIGALGYVAFVLELLNQLLAIGESPTRLYFPTGSQGTQAGIVVGARCFHAPFVPIGVAVEANAGALRKEALSLVQGICKLLNIPDAFTEQDIVIDDGYVGQAYGVPTEEGVEAIRLLARTEAIFLDPVYTGKAMAGMLADIRAGKIPSSASIIFLHTGGGPSIFAHGSTLVPGGPRSGR